MAASRTAEFVALYRAMENLEEAPRFRDPFASAFLSPRFARLLPLARVTPIRKIFARYSDWRAPGARTAAIARTCFIDGVVKDAVKTCDQLVILGAGFDCRAHRMPELAGVTVYEVDREATQAKKRERLAGRVTRGDVRYVRVDFARDDTSERLRAAGWDPARPTVLIWEGVTNYLTESAVAGVLSWIGTCAPGSVLVFTYIHAGLLDGTVPFAGGHKLMRIVSSMGEPWTFGLFPAQVAGYLEKFGLTLREDLGADQYRLRCGIRQDTGYSFYRAAVATRKV
jgi:methyltransferase (TIGR00027 family)